MLAAPARRLILLLAALITLVMAAGAALALVPAAHASGAQNRIRAFNPAALPSAAPATPQSSCVHPVSVASAAQLASGFCVATEEGPTVYRAARAGNGESELADGINPENHVTDAYGDSPGSTFVGSEDVAQKFAGQGPYESYYTAFKMSPQFAEEFDPFLYEGGPGVEYEIPYDQIDRFNDLTTSRTRVDP